MTTPQERDELERERAWDETHPRPDRTDEDLLHDIVRLTQHARVVGTQEARNPTGTLDHIEALARSLLLRLPEPPAARPLQMHERLAHDFVNGTAGDAALRAFAPTSRDEQMQVDRHEATR